MILLLLIGMLAGDFRCPFASRSRHDKKKMTNMVIFTIIAA